MGPCSTTTWFFEATGAALDADGEVDLTFETPCCQSRTSLNDLDYSWPQGFARASIAAVDPGRDWFTSEELEAIALALGRPVRQIFQHS